MFKSKQSAFSTIEILIASFILISAIGSSTVAVFLIQDLSLNNQLTIKALAILSSQLESATFENSPLNSEEQIDNYTIKKRYKALNRQAFELTVDVSWHQSASVSKTITGNTILTNNKNLFESDLCDLYLKTNASSHLISTLALPNNPNLTDIKVSGDILYLSADDPVLSSPDLYSYRIKEDNSLELISAINTGPGIAKLSVTQTFLYAANTSINSQLQILNISSNSPQLVKNYKLPNISGSSAVGSAIFYSNGNIYLGTLKTTGPEFNIIDVTNPSNPMLQGSFETNTLINSIVVDDKTAFIATPNQEQLRILNIVDPNAISLESSFSDSGFAVQDGKSIDEVGGKIFFGRTVGGVNNLMNHELYILNLDSDFSISKKDSKDLAASSRALFYRSDLIFVGTNDANKEWQVWSVLENSSLALKEVVNLPASVVAQTCRNNEFFLILEQGQIVIFIYD